MLHKSIRSLSLAAALAIALFARGSTARAAEPQSIGFLGVHFQNDNVMYEPTSPAETARLKALETEFTSKLEASGRYAFKPLPADLDAKIAAGQDVGDCGGCELDYGRALGTDTIAWIRVQKVSNLILNMNVYMADVKSGKMTFVRSVDIRGNTDESWARSLTWLLKNYLLAQPGT